MYKGFNTIGIIFLLFFTFYEFLFPKVRCTYIFFEKVIGKIGISYFTYRKMQSRVCKGCWRSVGLTGTGDVKQYQILCRR
jgi:hypothetical protein